MRIKALETRRYSLRLDPPFAAAWDPRPRDRCEETIVIVHTDGGVRGYAGGAPVPDRELLEEVLLDCAVDDTARVSEVCRTVDFHHGRNWTVEVAVHDALARAGDQPLWQFLGGSRDRYPAYASTGERLVAAARVDRTLEWQEQGIRALKLRFTSSDWRDDVAVAAAIRDAVGTSMEIMVDANHAWRMPGDSTKPWTPVEAQACAHALGELGVYWLEEPLPLESVGDYVGLRSRADVRIAGGEMVRSLAESRHLIASGALDVVQNDVVLAGGIAGARMVARWAGEAGIEWSPHTWTTGFGLLANLHAALAWSTAPYIEVPYDPPAWTPDRRDFMLREPLQIGGDGTIAAPLGPGLGPEPDFDELEQWRIA